MTGGNSTTKAGGFLPPVSFCLEAFPIANIERKDVIFSRESHGTRTHVRMINPDSGEVIGEYWEENRAAPSRKPQRKTKDDFGKLWMENWRYVVMRKRLSIPERGVLSSLWAFVDWESNYLVHPETGEQLTATKIGHLLGIDKKQALDYLNRLNEKGVISIVKRGGNGYENHHIMNTNLFFRGSQIKDIRQTEHFQDECPFVPKKEIQYTEREKGGNKEE